MKRYIAILRGINVGGKRKILMAELRELFSDLGFAEVKTYIQSGNVVFDVANAKRTEAEMSEQIEQEIAKRYGFEVPCLVRSLASWQDTVSRSPYADMVSIDLLHVTFLASSPTPEHINKLDAVDKKEDRYTLLDTDFYLACSGKYSDTKLSNQTIEAKLKVKATTRNWKTVLALLELAQ